MHDISDKRFLQHTMDHTAEHNGMPMQHSNGEPLELICNELQTFRHRVLACSCPPGAGRSSAKLTADRGGGPAWSMHIAIMKVSDSQCDTGAAALPSSISISSNNHHQHSTAITASGPCGLPSGFCNHATLILLRRQATAQPQAFLT